MPSNIALPYSCTQVDYQTGWKHALAPSKQKTMGIVYKRFLLDVGTNGLFWRKLRSFLLRKFQDAFVDMLREVELCVRSWGDVDSMAEARRVMGDGRPRFESAFSNDIAPKPRLWPRNGLDVKRGAAKLAGEFVDLIKMENEHDKQEKRERVVSASFFLPE